MAAENEVEFEDAEELVDWLVANRVSQSMAEKVGPSLYNSGFISSSALIGVSPDVLIANAYVEAPVAQILSNQLKPDATGRSLVLSSSRSTEQNNISRDREYAIQLQKLEKGELEGNASWDGEDEIPISPMAVNRTVQPVVTKTTVTRSYAASSTAPQSTTIITEATPIETARDAPLEQSFASQPSASPAMSYAGPIHLGHKPATITCQYCQATVLTRMYERIGTFAIIMLVVLILLFWPLFWLPLVLSGCKDKDHVCPNCNRKVGEAQADCDSC